MDKIQQEQEAIDEARAALDKRQARLDSLENLTEDQKTAIRDLYREEAPVAVEKKVLCPVCKLEYLLAGIKRHMSTSSEKRHKAFVQPKKDAGTWDSYKPE